MDIWTIILLAIAIGLALGVVFYDGDKQRSLKAVIYPQGTAATLARNGQGLTLIDKNTGFKIHVHIVETEMGSPQIVVQDMHDVFTKPAGRSDIWIGSGTIYSRGVSESQRFVVSWTANLILA